MSAISEVKSRLRISEIFYSLQGETDRVGLPTVFIRLTGCPLRCQYCDTSYAFHGGEYYSIEQVLQKTQSFATRYVTVTGGEPLAQKDCLPLLTALCDEGYDVSLETSGAMDIANVDPRVVKIVDIKTPASGEVSRNLLANLDFLSAADQIKFVICDREDFDWAEQLIDEYRLGEQHQVLFSPSHDQLAAGQLADWILAQKLNVRMQLQVHKYLWGDVQGR